MTIRSAPLDGDNVDFATGPETWLITVRVMRVPGNPLIKGTFWLDDMQLASTRGTID